MKIIRYLIIILVLCDLLYSFILSLNPIRNIGVYNISTDVFVKETKINGLTYNNEKIKITADSISNFLFLNNGNGNTSFTTVTLGLIIFVLVILLLFGNDLIRIKIYKSHLVPFFIGLLICSAIISWYFTKSFVDTVGTGVVNYKYQFSLDWLFTLFIGIDVVRRFKHEIDERNLQVELDRLSQQ